MQLHQKFKTFFAVNAKQLKTSFVRKQRLHSMDHQSFDLAQCPKCQSTNEQILTSMAGTTVFSVQFWFCLGNRKPLKGNFPLAPHVAQTWIETRLYASPGSSFLTTLISCHHNYPYVWFGCQSYTSKIAVTKLSRLFRDKAAFFAPELRTCTWNQQNTNVIGQHFQIYHKRKPLPVRQCLSLMQMRDTEIFSQEALLDCSLLSWWMKVPDAFME